MGGILITQPSWGSMLCLSIVYLDLMLVSFDGGFDLQPQWTLALVWTLSYSDLRTSNCTITTSFIRYQRIIHFHRTPITNSTFLLFSQCIGHSVSRWDLALTRTSVNRIKSVPYKMRGLKITVVPVFSFSNNGFRVSNSDTLSILEDNGGSSEFWSLWPSTHYLWMLIHQGGGHSTGR